MDAELIRRVDALRRPLELAAADNFTGVRKVAGLGAALLAACDGVMERITPRDRSSRGDASMLADAEQALAQWRGTLATWDQLDENQQAIVVAKGMRLIARFPRPTRPVVPVSRTFAPGLGASRVPGARIPAPALAPLAAPAPVASPARVVERPPRSSSIEAPRSDTTVAPKELAARRATSAAARAKGTASTDATMVPTIAVKTTTTAKATASTAKPTATATGSTGATKANKITAAAPATARTGTTMPKRRAGATSSTGAIATAAPTTGSTATGTATTGTVSTASTSTAARPELIEHRLDATPASEEAGMALVASALAAAIAGPIVRGAIATMPTSTPMPMPTSTFDRVALDGAGSLTPTPTPNTRTKAKAPAGEVPTADPSNVASDTAVAKPKRARAAAPAEPAEPIDPLAALTHTLPGIGPAFAERLAEKGLVTVEDLLWLVPRRYDDVRDAKTLAEVDAMPEGTRVTFAAKVVSARMIFARGRRWAEVRLTSIDPSVQLTAFGVAPPVSAIVRWFNVWAGIDKRMPVDAVVALSGVVKKRGGRLELANPDILGIEIDGVAGKAMPTIIARYPDVPGVPAGRMRSACASACARVAGNADDGVPATVEQAAGLPSLADTLGQLHSPSPDIHPDAIAALNRGDSEWQRRLAFGELFALGVAITLRRRERRGDAAVPCAKTPRIHQDLEAALPFKLTAAQRRSIDELGADLSRDVPMNRLLQGDVGAGKTCVAFAAALQVARAGRQTAVMAPTELLAEQHMETWRAWAKATKLRVEVLTASTQKGVRQSLLALLAGGQIDVLIGTHALLAEAVGFHALGLVVIDEQHRFGVAQRAKLRDKGDGNGAPHLLVMTATPIPRTLALTAFGDLDVSVLDELPPGRLPVATKQLSGSKGRSAAYKIVAERVAAGERAYVVCPKVEPTEGDEDDDRTWKDATTTAAELAADLPHVRVGLVHGRLDGPSRDRVMRAFKSGEIEVLVATTVIEVGVDVPAATVMVIHDAERFGLAQLHQLRGRVGRGGGASHCLLLAQGQLGPDAEHRLGAMVETHDGFKIAEYDLSLRGPGDLLGPKQAGVPRLRFGDLAQHTALLLEARRFAEQVLDEDPTLVRPQHAALRRAIERRFAHHVYGAESG
ncbi:MAG: box helicase domain protein [Myxococcales bacterium]|nr:box helicase domain protein [Myxococcales bacterium]